MSYELEYESQEIETGFDDEFEEDSGEFELEYDQESDHEVFDEEIGEPVRSEINVPRIGDRSGFQTPELDSEFEEEIFPPDSRQLIRSTTPLPWRFICQLLVGMRGSDGSYATGRGSGTVIGGKYILTCGHNLKVKVSGVTYTAQRVTVTPGLNTAAGKSKPFGSYLASSWRPHDRWKNSFDREYDFALVTLKSSLGAKTFRSLGNKPFGWWGGASTNTFLQALSPSSLKNKIVNVCGYPCDKCGTAQLASCTSACSDAKRSSTQWLSYDQVLDPEPPGFRRLLYHKADTKAGHSGSPVWRYFKDTKKRYLVAVHTGADSSASGTLLRNRAVRITNDVLSNLRAWGWRS